MKAQTSIVAEQIRLQEWSELIRNCQSRPININIETWCQQNGITKANYYYRLKRVREVCLSHMNKHESSFVELPDLSCVKPNHLSIEPKQDSMHPIAILRGSNNISIEIFANATSETVSLLLGAFAYVK